MPRRNQIPFMNKFQNTTTKYKVRSAPKSNNDSNASISSSILNDSSNSTESQNQTVNSKQEETNSTRKPPTPTAESQQTFLDNEENSPISEHDSEPSSASNSDTEATHEDDEVSQEEDSISTHSDSSSDSSTPPDIKSILESIKLDMYILAERLDVNGHWLGPKKAKELFNAYDPFFERIEQLITNPPTQIINQHSFQKRLKKVENTLERLVSTISNSQEASLPNSHTDKATTHHQSNEATLTPPQPGVVTVDSNEIEDTETMANNVRNLIKEAKAEENLIDVRPSKGSITLYTRNKVAAEELLNKCAAHQQKHKLHLELKPPPKKRAVLMAVPVDVDDSIILKNLAISTHSVVDNFTIPHRITRNQGTSNVVIEAPPKLINILLNQRSIVLDLIRHKIVQYLRIRRCTSCQAFGHNNHSCTSKTSHCEHCAGTHQTSDCENTSTVKCINCTRARIPANNHKASDFSCPSFHYYKKQQLMEIHSPTTTNTKPPLKERHTETFSAKDLTSKTINTKTKNNKFFNNFKT